MSHPVSRARVFEEWDLWATLIYGAPPRSAHPPGKPSLPTASFPPYIPKRGQEPGRGPRPALADALGWVRSPATLQEGRENKPGQREGMPPPHDAKTYCGGYPWAASELRLFRFTFSGIKALHLWVPGCSATWAKIHKTAYPKWMVGLWATAPTWAKCGRYRRHGPSLHKTWTAPRPSKSCPSLRRSI